MTESAPQFSVTCALCKHQMMLPVGIRTTVCVNCRASGRWFRCRSCQKVSAIWAKRDGQIWTFICRGCGVRQRVKVSDRAAAGSTSRRRVALWKRVVFTLVLAAFCAGMSVAMIMQLRTPTKPDLDCNGKIMQPGDTCMGTSYENGRIVGGGSETYEDRIAAAYKAPPKTSQYIAGTASMVLLFAVTETGAVLIWRNR
jgi:hypothetical protein